MRASRGSSTTVTDSDLKYRTPPAGKKRPFGALLGRGWGPFTNQKRKDALARVPMLAAVVRDHGEQSLLMSRLVIEMRNFKLRTTTGRLERTTRSLHCLPSEARLLVAIARTTEQIGVRLWSRPSR